MCVIRDWVKQVNDYVYIWKFSKKRKWCRQWRRQLVLRLVGSGKYPIRHSQFQGCFTTLSTNETECCVTFEDMFCRYGTSGAFDKLRKATINFTFLSHFVSACRLSDRQHWTIRVTLDGFLWYFILENLLKSAEKIPICLKSEKHIGCLTWRRAQIYGIILLKYFWIEMFSNKYIEKVNAHICDIFSRNVVLLVI